MVQSLYNVPADEFTEEEGPDVLLAVESAPEEDAAKPEETEEVVDGLKELDILEKELVSEGMHIDELADEDEE
jgi:hypothetical protein